MRRLLLLAGVLIAFGPTAALAENWVAAQSPSLMTMYDADSVYVKAATGLVYVTACDEVACAAGKTTQATAQYRVDCSAKTEARLIGQRWTAPARQASNDYLAGDNEYLPGTSAALMVTAVCAKKASWPKR